MYVCWGSSLLLGMDFAKIFERQPFRFGCIVLMIQILTMSPKIKRRLFGANSELPNNNFEEKQSEIVNKDPIVLKLSLANVMIWNISIIYT